MSKQYIEVFGSGDTHGLGDYLLVRLLLILRCLGNDLLELGLNHCHQVCDSLDLALSSREKNEQLFCRSLCVLLDFVLDTLGSVSKSEGRKGLSVIILRV